MDLRERWRDLYRTRQEDVRRLVEEYPERRSLYVDLVDLHGRDPEFAEALFSDPDRVLSRGGAVLVDRYDGLDWVNVRVENHPGLIAADAVRSRHVDELVTVEGTVVELGPVGARLGRAVYTCRGCDHDVRRYATGIESPKPARCPECGDEFSLRPSASQFVDVQRLGIRAEGGGRLDIYIDDDLVGAVELDQQVLATGVVRLDRREAKALFDFYLTVLSVDIAPPEVDRERDDEEIQDLIQERWELIN